MFLMFFDLVNFKVPWIVVFLLFAAAAVGRYYDIHYSQRFVTYGGFEANPLWRDKFGFFAAKGNIIASAATLIVILILCFTISTQWSFAFIAIAVGSLIIAFFKNKKTTDYLRDEAVTWLRGLRERVYDVNDPDNLDAVALYLQGRYAVRGGRTWRENVPTVWSTKTGTYVVPGVFLDGQPALGSVPIDDVNEKLKNLVKQPEETWFTTPSDNLRGT